MNQKFTQRRKTRDRPADSWFGWVKVQWKPEDESGCVWSCYIRVDKQVKRLFAQQGEICVSASRENLQETPKQKTPSPITSLISLSGGGGRQPAAFYNGGTSYMRGIQLMCGYLLSIPMSDAKVFTAQKSNMPFLHHPPFFFHPFFLICSSLHLHQSASLRLKVNREVTVQCWLKLARGWENTPSSFCLIKCLRCVNYYNLVLFSFCCPPNPPHLRVCSRFHFPTAIHFSLFMYASCGWMGEIWMVQENIQPPSGVTVTTVTSLLLLLWEVIKFSCSSCACMRYFGSSHSLNKTQQIITLI